MWQSNNMALCSAISASTLPPLYSQTLASDEVNEACANSNHFNSHFSRQTTHTTQLGPSDYPWIGFGSYKALLISVLSIVTFSFCIAEIINESYISKHSKHGVSTCVRDGFEISLALVYYLGILSNSIPS